MQKEENMGGILEKIREVEGFLEEIEAKFLFLKAKECSKGSVIVEIGSWKGKSTICLAEGSKTGSRAKVYAIDPHTGSKEHGNVWTFPEFKKNIAKFGHEDIVVPIVKTSRETIKDWNKPIGLLFIDGSHEYEDVKFDFEAWSPFVVEGGIVAFHDFFRYEGVTRVARKGLFFSRSFKDVGLIHSIAYGRKVHKNTIIEWIRNFFYFGYNYIWMISKKIIPSFVAIPLGKILRKMHLLK